MHNIYWLGTPASDIDASEVRGLICFEKLVKNEARKMKVHLMHKQKVYEKLKRLHYEG